MMLRQELIRNLLACGMELEVTDGKATAIVHSLTCDGQFLMSANAPINVPHSKIKQIMPKRKMILEEGTKAMVLPFITEVAKDFDVDAFRCALVEQSNQDQFGIWYKLQNEYGETCVVSSDFVIPFLEGSYFI